MFEPNLIFCSCFALETIIDKSKQEDERVSDELSKKLEEALTAKQESEAKLTQIETRLQEYEAVINEVQKSVSSSSILV